MDCGKCNIKSTIQCSWGALGTKNASVAVLVMGRCVICRWNRSEVSI